MDEALRFVEILNKNNKITFFGETSKIFLEDFSKNMEHCTVINHDRPDIVLECLQKVYLLEHFEFDSSEKLKKGTKMRIESAKIQRDFDELVDSKLKEGYKDAIYRSATYRSNRTIDDYTNNFINNFENHYAKIEGYINNTKSYIGNKEIELGFVIENTSILVDVILNHEKKPAILLPINLTKILDYLKTKTKLTNIFYICHNGNTGFDIYYFRNEPKSFDEYDQLGVPIYDNFDLIEWEAHTIGATIFIPHKE